MVQAEALAVTDGLSFGKVAWTDKAGNVTGIGDALHAVDRLQVPLLLRVTPPGAARLRPFVFAGPYGAFRLLAGYSL